LIEGNTLTLVETKVVLEGITVGGKTMRKHLEVINHQEAITYVEDITSKGEPLSQWKIKHIHRLNLERHK
jgi:Fic family protein